MIFDKLENAALYKGINENIDLVLEKAKEYITRFGGTITDVEDWGKKKLAYDIQKMPEGYFYFIHFEAETTAPAEIENRVRIMDNVLRFLIVNQDEA